MRKLAPWPHALTSKRMIHPLGGCQTQLRFLALPLDCVRPRLFMGTHCFRGEIQWRACGFQLPGVISYLHTGTALLKHLVARDQQNAGDRCKEFSRGNHPRHSKRRWHPCSSLRTLRRRTWCRNVIAHGLGQPCCSKITGTTPSKTKKVLGLDGRSPYSLHFSYSMCANSLGMLQSGLAMPILTSIQMSVPLGSETAGCTARASRAAG